MQSDATSVQQYLSELPEDRRSSIAAVRNLVITNLPDGMIEDIGFEIESVEG